MDIVNQPKLRGPAVYIHATKFSITACRAAPGTINYGDPYPIHVLYCGGDYALYDGERENKRYEKALSKPLFQYTFQEIYDIVYNNGKP